MIDTKIVKRYAAALFGSAQAADVVDLVESDLGLITYSFETAPRLREAIESPLIPAAKKREIVTSIFHGKIHEITLHYLYLLIDNRREEAVLPTEAEYIRLANEARGIITAQVTAAIELTDDELTRLRAKLSAQTDKKVALDVAIDPSIIGGLIVRIGDTVLDGSVKGHLERIKEKFLSA